MTINFKQPDRVPIDLGSMKASGIAVSAYNRLKRHLGLKGPARIHDTRLMIARVEEDVMKRLNADVLPLDMECAQWWAENKLEQVKDAVGDRAAAAEYGKY